MVKISSAVLSAALFIGVLGAPAITSTKPGCSQIDFDFLKIKMLMNGAALSAAIHHFDFSGDTAKNAAESASDVAKFIVRCGPSAVINSMPDAQPVIEKIEGAKEALEKLAQKIPQEAKDKVQQAVSHADDFLKNLPADAKEVVKDITGGHVTIA